MRGEEEKGSRKICGWRDGLSAFMPLFGSMDLHSNEDGIGGRKCQGKASDFSGRFADDSFPASIWLTRNETPIALTPSYSKISYSQCYDPSMCPSLRPSRLNIRSVCSRHIENRPHPNLHNLIVAPIGHPRPKEPRPSLHRRIQQPQTRRLHKFPTHHLILPLHHQLQRQRPKRETLVAATGRRVRGGLGRGVFEKADEGCGGGEFGTDGDEGGEDAGIAIGELLDSEGGISFLRRLMWCCT